MKFFFYWNTIYAFSFENFSIPEVPVKCIALPSHDDLWSIRVQEQELVADLLQSDATLHVVTHSEFRFAKANLNKQFLGTGSCFNGCY